MDILKLMKTIAVIYNKGADIIVMTPLSARIAYLMSNYKLPLSYTPGSITV